MQENIKTNKQKDNTIEVLTEFRKLDDVAQLQSIAYVQGLRAAQEAQKEIIRKTG